MTLKSKIVSILFFNIFQKPNDFVLYEPKQCILTYIESPPDMPEELNCKI